MPHEIGEAYLCGSYQIEGKWDCCVLRNTIQVKNCGEYFVYLLVPQDRCNVGYCIIRECIISTSVFI